MVLGYARVSKEEQAYAFALEQQVYRLQAAGATKVYADVASRTIDDRAALMEVCRLASTCEVETVLITRLDRVTSSPGLFEQISKIFRASRVNLKALDETVDIHSVDGEFTAGLQVHFARREVRTISLRGKSSNEVRRMKNRANTATPWGYRNNSGEYELDHAPFLCLLSDRPLGKTCTNIVSPDETRLCDAGQPTTGVRVVQFLPISC